MKYTRSQIETLKAGDLAPNYRGEMARVVSVGSRGEKEGKVWVSYFTEENSYTVASMILVENEEI